MLLLLTWWFNTRVNRFKMFLKIVQKSKPTWIQTAFYLLWTLLFIIDPFVNISQSYYQFHMVLLRGHNQNLGSKQGTGTTTTHWVQMLGKRINCSPTAAALIGRSHGSLQSPANCFQMWAVSPWSNQPASNIEPFDCTQTWPVRLPNRPPAPPLACRLGLTLCVRLS